MSALSRTQIVKVSLFGMLAVSLLGCGSGAKVAEIKEPEAFPFVQCKVVMSGQDIPGAVVTFHGEGAKDQKIVGAFDSENDVYRFVTSTDGKKLAGVPEGEYKVSVKPGRGTKAKIPAKYGDPGSSGLTAKVTKGENFLPPFELIP